MRKLIPAPVISIVADIASKRETHATLDSLFMYAGAPGDPPAESKHAKALAWLRRINQDESVEPLEVLGRLIEGYMDEEIEDFSNWAEESKKDKARINKALQNAKLQYVAGGLVIGALAAPSISLEESIKKRNISVLNEEFDRALKTVESSPKDALSAACNILESVCKVYIEEEEGLEMPAKQDLQPVWSVVRKDLGFDPSQIEDRDLKEILSGLIATVHGVGALRTHASSAHGSGAKSYRVEPRHARLAIHAAHTVVLFVLESWDKRRKNT